MDQEALIIVLQVTGRDLGSREEQVMISRLEQMLQDISAEVGEYDGHEFGGGVCRFYVYGFSADEMASRILPVIKSMPVSSGAFAVKRYGGLGAHEQRIALI